MNLRQPLTLALFALAPLLSSAVDAPPSVEGASRPNQGSRPVLAVGMTSEDIRAAIGDPARVKPVKNDEARVEIWIYNYSKVVGSKQVVTSTQEVPYFDSMSNSIKTRAEPVYGLENTSLTETTELLLVNGLLVSTKRYRNADRSFD